MNEKNIESISTKLKCFAKERDWDQFHTPKNLVLALNGEVGELSEIFQWLTEEEALNLTGKAQESAEEEVADVFLYLLRLSDVLGIDLIEAANKKIDINAQKYPIEKSKGSRKKYNEL
jgi:dCTP diphosphatase